MRGIDNGLSDKLITQALQDDKTLNREKGLVIPCLAL
jgi:hypothetical protein